MLYVCVCVFLEPFWARIWRTKNHYRGSGSGRGWGRGRGRGRVRDGVILIKLTYD